MNNHEKINYVEFPAKDIEKAKAFFSRYLTGLLLTMVLNIQPSPMQASTVVFSNLICRFLPRMVVRLLSSTVRTWSKR